MKRSSSWLSFITTTTLTIGALAIGGAAPAQNSGGDSSAQPMSPSAQPTSPSSTGVTQSPAAAGAGRIICVPNKQQGERQPVAGRESMGRCEAVRVHFDTDSSRLDEDAQTILRTS